VVSLLVRSNVFVNFMVVITGLEVFGLNLRLERYVKLHLLSELHVNHVVKTKETYNFNLQDFLLSKIIPGRHS